MKVYEVFAAALRAHGVDAMFGLMGNGNMHYVAAYRDAGSRFVAAVHEGGAVGMADAYSRFTGGVGVASVTHGPALTNTMTSLVEAVRHRSPVLLLTGETPPEPTHFQRIDISATAKAAGAGYDRVYQPGSVVRDLNRAMQRAVSERRPIVLDVPISVLLEEAPSQHRVVTPHTVEPSSPDAEALDSALGLLASASRPVIIAGRGAVLADAGNELAALGDLLGAALGTTALAKEMFAGHPRNIGIVGSLSRGPAPEILGESDCIIAFGASLNAFTTYKGELLANKRVIHVDADPQQINGYAAVDEGIVGDARLVARTIRECLEGSDHSSQSGSWSTSVARRVTDRDPHSDYVDTSTERTVDVRSAALRLDSALPRNRTVVSDIGRFLHGTWPYLQPSSPHHFTSMGAFGSIGLGLAGSIGAAIALPDQLTVLVIGDGGLMLNLAELNTAVQERLPILIALFNDGAYGAEHHQLKAIGLNADYTLTSFPDLTDVARAMGVKALDVHRLHDLDAVSHQVKELEGPLLVNIHLDPQVNPIEG